MTRVRAIDWKLIERALVTWVAKHADLPRASVRWGNQDARQPNYPYVSMLRISGPSKDNGLTDNKVSEKKMIDGREMLEVTVSGARQFVVSIQAHTDRFDDPNLDGVAIATTLQSSLELDEVQEQLATDADLTVVDPGGDVSDTSQRIGGDWMSRGTFEVRFRVASVITEIVDFIESVEMESDELDIPPFTT